ncbi:MAG: ATP-dependent endonuclease [Candidatus Xenobiia bacterium LiM19]
MYISKVRIQNYRCFEDKVIEFNDGLNVIIGENNSGKTTLLKALGLIFNRSSSQRPTVHDFHKGLTTLDEPPGIIIEVTLSESQTESMEDRAVVAGWLTRLSTPWEAQLTYQFLLPEKYIEEYKGAIEKAENVEEKWDVLERNILKYKSYIYGGNPSSKNRAEAEWLEKIGFKLLDALRDVEREMFSGSDPLLKRMLDLFLDYDLKKGDDKDKEKIGAMDKDFQTDAGKLSKSVTDRINLTSLLDLARRTGAEDGGKIDFGGRISKADVISTLQLMVEHMGRKIPIIGNGLGYNNLIYISMIISELILDKKDRLGDNSVIFPILLIEEPEAHLHPALQYRILKFLTREMNERKISRQIFVTSHSTHITAAVPLDSIIITSLTENGDIDISYPGRVFSDSNEDLESKKYIERYLDATKSAMLFAKAVILVEGISEQILLPCLAEYVLLDSRKCLEDHSISIVAVGGQTFKHFIKLFGGGTSEEKQNVSLQRKVACILDSDPSRIDRSQKKPRWKACFPFEIGLSPTCEYRCRSQVIDNLNASISVENVKIFHNATGKGKTLEYDLAYENHENPILDSLEDSLPQELEEALILCTWNDEEKKKSLVACSFLQNNAVGRKGECSFDLALKLRKELDSESPGELKVPEHIRDAIRWVCNLE